MAENIARRRWSSWPCDPFKGEEARGAGKVGAVPILLLALGFSLQAVPLGFESGPHFFQAYPPALSAFVQLVNASLSFGNDVVEQDDVPPLPLISGGLGLRAAETLGGPFSLGLGFSAFGAATRTAGAWADQLISVDLGLHYADLHLALLFSPLPGMLWLSAFLGVGSATVAYAVSFPSSVDGWGLPFVPAAGEWAFSGRAVAAGFWARVAFPLLPVLTAGLEFGYRWALFPALFAGNTPMDLEQDGNADPLDLSGFWLGVTLRVEFSL